MYNIYNKNRIFLLMKNKCNINEFKITCLYFIKEN